MANKKNPECVNKDIMLRVRVTAEEREKFTVMAKEKGFKSVSEYIRSLVADEEKSLRNGGVRKKHSTIQHDCAIMLRN